MLHVPARFATVLVAFAPVFVQARTWQHAQMLLLGALLVPGQRTVCSILPSLAQVLADASTHWQSITVDNCGIM